MASLPMAHMRLREGPRGFPAMAAAWRQHWPRLLGALVVCAALLFVVRQPLAERLWPQARLDRLLAEADQALAAGWLDGPEERPGARQKFEAALALDNDRGEARDGLLRVGGAALLRANAAIRAGNLEEARRWVALARELQLPRNQVEPVAAWLHRAEAAATDLDALRGRAAAALAAGDIEAALPLYARWLELRPDDGMALEGREDALALLLQPVRAALRDGDLAGAARRLALARRYDPGYIALPDLQDAYAQALAAQVRAAGQVLRRGRLEQAARAFSLLQPLAPEDPAVQDGVRDTAVALAAQARREAAEFRFDAAASLLEQARVLAPENAAVEDAARAVEQARQARSRMQPGQGSARATRSAVRRSLAAFNAALERGDWIDPPGASAYDHLRAAQALAPADPDVGAAAKRMRGAAAQCVDASLRDNRLRLGQRCLDAWQALAPSDPALGSERQRLAQRWLAVGEERLRAGEVDVAARALSSARGLDPAAPGLDEFDARLDQAQRATPL